MKEDNIRKETAFINKHTSHLDNLVQKVCQEATVHML